MKMLRELAGVVLLAIAVCFFVWSVPIGDGLGVMWGLTIGVVGFALLAPRQVDAMLGDRD